MSEGGPTVNFAPATASGEARPTNIGLLTTQTLNLALSQEHYSQSSLKKEVIPDSTCPFTRDEHFIARKDIFEKLKEIHIPSAQYRWAGLYGLGGIGKSQIAVEYTFRVRDEDPSVWVFWIYASSTETVKQSFRTAVQRLDLPGHEDPKADIPGLLERWLSEKQNGPWLVVLDNADDADVFRQHYPEEPLDPEQSRPLLTYIPQKPHGRVLVTSRDKKTAFALVQAHTSLVPVGPMSEKESIALLRSRIEHGVEEEKLAKDLVLALDYVPLAISQAGAYIQQQGELYSISEYLNEFRASELKQITLLNQQSEELRRDSQVPNSIILAWEISFRQLETKNVEASNLLCLMSVLHRQNIPLELIRLHETISTRNALALLEAFSFINVSRPSQTLFSDDERILTLHRLIQLATRKWLKIQGQLVHWRAIGLKRVSTLMPLNPDYECWNHCSMLLLHAQETLKCDHSEEEEVEISRGVLLEKLAQYDMEMGNYDRAVERATKSLEMYRLHYQDDHTVLLRGMSTMASAYRHQGQWTKAEKLFTQVMEIRKTKLGVDHLDTLTSIGNLASTYWDQGRLEEAEQLDIQVIETRKTKLGVDHLDTLSSMHSLATTYRQQGRLDEAEQLEVQVIEISKTKLGVDHPDTLISIATLAAIYWNQGRLDEAEQLEVQVIEIRKTKLGVDHPDTLISIANLAFTYLGQGRLEEAEQLYIQVIEIRKTKLGLDHPDTLTGIANLALTYWYQGRFEEAEQLEVQVIEIRKTKLGVDHPDTLSSMNNLAITYMDSGRASQAISLMREAVKLRIRKLGENHQHTIESQETLHSWEAEHA